MSKPLVRDKGARTPMQLARQEEAFRLAVIERKSYLAIADEMGIDRDTVSSDVEAESERRALENEKRRESETMAMLAQIDAIVADEWESKRLIRGMMLEPRERGNLRIVDNTSPNILKAMELKARILGLESPLKVDLGLQMLIDAIEPRNVTPALESDAVEHE